VVESKDVRNLGPDDDDADTRHESADQDVRHEGRDRRPEAKAAKQ
jgi:hypothetical protein